MDGSLIVKIFASVIGRKEVKMGVCVFGQMHLARLLSK